MEKWRSVWRNGVAPVLPSMELTALRDALAKDDPRLIQGATSKPPPLDGLRDFPVEAACALGFCGWQGEGLASVREVIEFFNRICTVIDDLLDDPAGCRHFLNWFDNMPREKMRLELLSEVELTLKEKEVSFKPV